MKDELLGMLRSCSGPKICVLGIGSEFKADDSAGVVVVEELQKRFDSVKHSNGDKVMFINGATAPENFTGDIKRFAPTHLIIVDAAEMGETPGTVKLIPNDKVGGISFSTHVLPIAVMINYLKQSINFESSIIGVEPQVLEFGAEMSKEVKEAVCVLSGNLFEAIETCLNN